MKSVMNIAIVAYGRIAKTHILAAYMANLKLALPFELKVSHIITSRPDSIKFSNIKVFQTLQAALDETNDIDIVDICNINEAHYNDILLASKYKKAIYCEKPLTNCIEKSSELASYINKQQLCNAVPLIFRYLPCIHMLKEELINKTLGKIISFEAHYYHCGYLNKDKRTTWRTKKSSGGGASIDLGIHMIDLIRFIFNEPLEVENKLLNHFKDTDTDEIFQSKMQFSDGLCGELKTSRIFMQQKQSIYIEVFCEKGSYLCDLTHPYLLQRNEFQGSTMYLKPNYTKDYMKYFVEESNATSFHLDAHMCCLADFARKVAGIDHSNYDADFTQAFLSQNLLFIK